MGIVNMTKKLRRKLYKRGSSYETTIPMPLLFGLDEDKRHYVVFNFEKETNSWYITFEEMGED